MNKKYIVRLSDEKRAICHAVIKKLQSSSQKVRRVHLLLESDSDGPARTDQEIAEAFYCRIQTVENLRKHVVIGSFKLALWGKKHETSPTPPETRRRGRSETHRHASGQRASELNLMDQLWGQAKDIISANLQYPIIDDQVQAFVEYLGA